MAALWWPTDRLRGQVCSLACELAATWRRLTFIRVTQVKFCIGFAIDDSTINLVLLLLLVVLSLLS